MTVARSRKLDSPVTPLVLALLAIGAFVTWRLEQRGWDPSLFVLAGDRFFDPAADHAGLKVGRDSQGYDGQFCYRLALDPLTRRQDDFGIRLDLPRKRQQRILYPVLAWLASGGGRPAAVAWALLGVNCAALCAMAWLGGRLARAVGRHAAWGVVFPLSAPYALSLARDLNEIVAGTMVLAALLAMERRRPVCAALALALAVLARETSLILVAGAGIDWLWRRARREPRLVPLGVVVTPALTWLAWQAWLWRVWSTSGGELTSDLGAPGVAMLGFWREVAAMTRHQDVVSFIQISAMVAWAAAVLACLEGSRAPRWVKVACVLALTLQLCFGRFVWVEDWSFLRVFADAYLLGTLVLLGSAGFIGRLALAGGLLAFVAQAAEVLVHR